jgi:hypothetical protein
MIDNKDDQFILRNGRTNSNKAPLNNSRLQEKGRTVIASVELPLNTILE